MATESNGLKKITLLAKLDWYCFCTGPSCDGIGVSELVGALMGMTLVALASADPARSPTPPRCGAHLGRAATSAIAASPSRHRPAVASAVIVPPPRSWRPSRRSAGRRCAAASAAAAPPPRSPPARARRHCAAEPLSVTASTRHCSAAAAAAAAIAAAATRSRVRRRAATSAVVRCHVRC